MLFSPKNYDVIIVTCGSAKLNHPAAAEDLYSGTYFKACKNLAKKTGLPWFILSSEHGLMEPTKVINPYSTVWHKSVLGGTKQVAGGTRVLSEEERSSLAQSVKDKTKGKRVLVLLSDPYRRYFPEFTFMSDLVKTYCEENNLPFSCICTYSKLYKQYAEGTLC